MATKGRRVPELLQKEIDDGQFMVECATNGNLEGLKDCVEANVSINADEYNRSLFYKSQNYMTPLLCAAKFGHGNCVSYLIKQEGKHFVA